MNKKSGAKKAPKKLSRANGRVTVERILQYARQELVSAGPVEFNIDRVLRRSKVSRSSLYHHFKSRDGLIIALEFERAYTDLLGEMELIRQFVLQSPDLKTVFEAIEFALTTMGEKSAQDRRRQRVETLAAGSRSSGLHRLLADAQHAGSEHFIETLRLASEKGLIKLNEPIDGIAYLIQSIFVGRILVDLTGDGDIDKVWVKTTMSVMRHLLRPGPKATTASSGRAN